MNKSPNPQLKKTCRIGRLICQNKLFRINGFTLLNYTDVGLAGVDFDFVAVVVIELGRCEVAGLFPGYMDALAVCEVVAVFGVVVALERQITLRITGFIISKLN